MLKELICTTCGRPLISHNPRILAYDDSPCPKCHGEGCNFDKDEDGELRWVCVHCGHKWYSLVGRI